MVNFVVRKQEDRNAFTALLGKIGKLCGEQEAK